MTLLGVRVIFLSTPHIALENNGQYLRAHEMNSFYTCPNKTLTTQQPESRTTPLITYLLISWYACSEGVTDRRRAQANNTLL